MALSAEDVVPDITNLTDDPTVGFAEIWPDGTESFILQVGVNGDSASLFDLGSHLADARANSLGLQGMDVVNDLEGAFTALETALRSIGSHRAGVGSAMNALRYASSNLDTHRINLRSGQSTIEDADFAAESSSQLLHQILVKASSAMLLQANQSRSTLLRLIENAG